MPPSELDREKNRVVPMTNAQSIALSAFEIGDQCSILTEPLCGKNNAAA